MLWAQQMPPLGQGVTLLQGFTQKVKGDDMMYNSSVPDIKKAMIVRAYAGGEEMIWKTQKIPASQKGDYVTFVWVAGMGVNLGNARMDLNVDGMTTLPFYTSRKKSWKVEKDGFRLLYHTTLVDGCGDLFGFMYLQIPRNRVKKGQSLTLSVTGSKSNSQAWYMTFQSPITSGVKFKAYPSLYKEKGKRLQSVGVNIFYFGKPQPGEILYKGKVVKRVNLAFGHNNVMIGVPAVKKPTTVALEFRTKGLIKKEKVTIKPVRPWQVNLVQHSHTDIGYTRSQTEIMAEHLRYIDYALDFCDATDNYPDDSKFRWVCEAAWAVDEYIKCRPHEQVERLKRRVKEGRIEITGMYFNFDEMPDEQTLAASLEPMRNFRKEGLEVTTAMQNDVNGIGWCFNDYYQPLGVKYLSMGTHGHRALICFDKPTSFWWESPSGARMLAFRGEHYMTGNSIFKIQTADMDRIENEIFAYLQELEQRDYPYNLIPIQYSGYLTDNSPPSTIANEVVRKWNKKYEYPKLRCALARDFFQVIEKEHGKELPVYRGAWPDWWTDGFASGAREAAASRQTHVDLLATQGALSMARLMGAKMPQRINHRVEDANKALLFYDEHTFGSSESVRDPFGESTMDQRANKESYVYEAFKKSRMIQEEAMGQLQSFFKKSDVPVLVVYNTLNWSRSGLHTVYIDHQMLPLENKFRIVDEQGKEVPAQPMSTRSDGTYWALWLDDVPAFGYKSYRIEVLPQEVCDQQKEKEVAPNVLENRWYRVELDTKGGWIRSIFDKELGKELVDADSPWKLGEFILEKLGNRSQMEVYKLDDYERFKADTLCVEGSSEGPVWNSIRLSGESSTCIGPRGITCEIRLFNHSKRIGLAYKVRKKANIDPESIYIAFPFNMDSSKLYFDVQGGTIEAGVDQIPGSSNDWNTVQNYAAVRSDKGQIVMVSPEIPMMQFGGINTGRYKAGATPESSHIFSWPMNNYWVTNFNADQRGELRWNYYLTSGEDNSNTFASRFGWGCRVPFCSRVLPPGKKTNELAHGSLLNIVPKNVLLVNASVSPDGEYVVLHVREINGEEAAFKVNGGTTHSKLSLQETNVLGEPMGNWSKVINMKPYQVKFIRIPVKG